MACVTSLSMDVILRLIDWGTRSMESTNVIAGGHGPACGIPTWRANRRKAQRCHGQHNSALDMNANIKSLETIEIRLSKLGGLIGGVENQAGHAA